MDIMITSSHNEKFFVNKHIITLGTSKMCNFKLNLEYEVLMSIRYNLRTKNYYIINTFSNPNVLYCRVPLTNLELGQLNKIFFKNSSEYLTIRVLNRILI